MRYDSDRALELLRIGSGLPDATFRDGQDEAIRRIVEGRSRLLVVQKTGWGKSFVYFIATKLLREAGRGPALLVSPLLALMRNQIAAAERMGVRAETINSSNEEQWSPIEQKVHDDQVDILLISPERLANRRFQEKVLGIAGGEISLLVIDEAHCISDWGHDFRPDYRRIERMIRELPPNMRLLATTATANDRVMEDLCAVLGPDMTVIRGDLARPSLNLSTIRLQGHAERLAWLATSLDQIDGHGIIYTLTIREAAMVTAWLKTRGHAVETYTGDSGDRRPQLEQALLDNEVKALVATTALGMGFDKPDLAFVIHYQTPGSVVAYYQQVGRAGRALEAAYGVLLGSEEDLKITSFFIDSAFPSRADVEQVLELLEDAPDGLTNQDILRRLNISFGRIERTLKLLSLESPAPIVLDGNRWTLTAANLGESLWERAARLTALRREEQAQMQEYLHLDAGHMEYLVQALDGESDAFMPPALPPLPAEIDPDLRRTAAAFLRGYHSEIAPRKKWPSGGMPALDVGGTIPADSRAEPGKALCSWGDAEWGREIEEGKYSVGRFADTLVGALARMITEWAPEPPPAWVTCIPSSRHPTLVPDLARRVARKLGLPFVATLESTGKRPEQKEMKNSVQQALNADGAMRVLDARIPDGPVVLIDDMVDSRWTFTVAAHLLRSAGSGPVFPVALASTASGAS